MRARVTVDKIHTLTGHRDCVYTLEKTQFDDAFFSAAGDGIVALWNLQDPENGELIANLPNSVYGIHYSAEHNVLFAGHNYDGVHLLDYQEKKEIGSVNMTTAAIFDIKPLAITFLLQVEMAVSPLLTSPS